MSWYNERQDTVLLLKQVNGDVKDLAIKMEWLITHESERKKMGVKARLWAANRVLPVVMSEYEKLLSSIVYL